MATNPLSVTQMQSPERVTQKANEYMQYTLDLLRAVVPGVAPVPDEMPAFFGVPIGCVIDTTLLKLDRPYWDYISPPTTAASERHVIKSVLKQFYAQAEHVGKVYAVDVYEMSPQIERFSVLGCIPLGRGCYEVPRIPFAAFERVVDEASIEWGGGCIAVNPSGAVTGYLSLMFDSTAPLWLTRAKIGEI